MNYIEMYFDNCLASHVIATSREEAIRRAIWWDCADAWNIYDTWDNEKIAFINRYVNYKPYDPIPHYQSEGWFFDVD